MNVRKTIFVTGGSLIILLLLGIRLGWFGEIRKHSASSQSTPAAAAGRKSAPAAAVKKVQPVQKAAAKAVPAPAAADKQPARTVKVPEENLGLGDPFVYSNASSGDYTPVSGSRHVGSIAVRGIICMAGENPRAILHLKESDRVHYVTKGSVVRVSAKGKKGAGPAEAYIVVKEIRNDEVELIQLERPDKVIIVR